MRGDAARRPLFFKDFSQLNRQERMRYWDEQMGVRRAAQPARPSHQALTCAAASQVLLSLPNVLITPHSAFLTNEALGNIASA